MNQRQSNSSDRDVGRRDGDLDGFSSERLNRIRSRGGVLDLPGGQVLLPRVFGFCRGVKRALAMLEQAVAARRKDGRRLFLLGQIIHNPWVNEYFVRRGVRVFSAEQMEELEKFVAPDDCCVIPAFGIPLPLERRLRGVGCEIVDTSCGDVRRLWRWTERAVERGFGVLIYGRADHDETVVTKSRLAAAGGRYVVVGNTRQASRFCEMIAGAATPGEFAATFDFHTTNAESIEPFTRLAQVSQTTMLYDETMKVRERIEEAFRRRFGRAGAKERLLFQPTVCRATQDRQTAAVELCRSQLQLVMVVGGFGSSNTRHLYELARQYAPAYFIETAAAIRNERELETVGPAGAGAIVVNDWLPARRPLRIGVLAGASSPEIVVGQVIQKLADILSP